MEELTTMDRIALYVGGGLVLLGTAGIGLLEIVAGAPHPVTDEGQVVHETLIPIRIRSYIILLGLLIWAVYAIYKLLSTTPSPRRRSEKRAGAPTEVP